MSEELDNDDRRICAGHAPRRRARALRRAAAERPGAARRGAPAAGAALPARRHRHARDAAAGGVARDRAADARRRSDVAAERGAPPTSSQLRRRVSHLARRDVRRRRARGGACGRRGHRPAVACRSPPEGGRYVAVVDTGGHEPALIAEVDTTTGIIRVRSLTAETPAGRSLELWHVPEGQQPRSLGILKAGLDAQTIKDAAGAGQRHHRRFGRAGGRLAVRRADRADRLHRAADPG